MGNYLDLHVIPRPEDSQSCERMADLLSEVHYRAVGLTVATGLLNERIRVLRRIFEDRGLDTVLRVDLKPSSRAELLRLVRRFRNLYDIIAVGCLNQQVATVSCRDSRVDIVFFHGTSRNLRFSHTFARLLRGAIELNIVSDLINSDDGSAFARLRRAISVAREHRVKVVLSSGARSFEMVRSPFQMSSLAITLGLNPEDSIRAVSSTPWSIVAANRMKRASEYVEEGVKIVVPSRR